MHSNKYKNIQLTTEINSANCITHSGKFHVDDVISTIFLSKIIDDVVLLRIPSIGDKDIKNKIVYDIGLGKFDHHQKNRNGKRDNGIYYSSIGLLWKEFGKKYLKKIGVKYIDKTFEYMDKELIQNIDAADNMQFEYVENKISPDFIKLFNPVWNEDVLEDEAFINALRLADEFWEIYMKNAISKIEGIEVISNKVAKCKEDYIIFDKEMPYKEATQLFTRNKIKYIILKSRREGYEIRIIANKCRFKDEIVLSKDINNSKKITEISDLKYVDNHGKLCCTETLDSAIKLIKYNENKI